MKQILERRKLGGVAGFAIVVGLVALLLALNMLAEGVLAPLIGLKASSIAFWLCGFALALVVLRVFVLGFVYEMNEDVLRLSRKYGKRERHIEDIYLAKLAFVGEPDRAEQKYPKCKRVVATYDRKAKGVLAIVYKSVDGLRIAYIEPNEQLREALIRARTSA